MNKKKITAFLTALCLIASSAPLSAMPVSAAKTDTAKEQAVSLPSGGLLPIRSITRKVKSTKAHSKAPKTMLKARRAAVNSSTSSERTYWDSFSSGSYYSQFDEVSKQIYERLDDVCYTYLLGNETKEPEQISVSEKDPSKKMYSFSVDFAGISGITEDNVDNVVKFFLKNSPQYYYLFPRLYSKNTVSGSKDIVSVSLFLYDDYATKSDRVSATAELKTKLNGYINAAKGLSDDVEKETYIHDKLSENLTYDEYGAGTGGKTKKDDYTNEDQSVMSVFLKTKPEYSDRYATVCAGYAKAFSMLMNALDIDAVYVTSSSHAWDEVKIGSHWYIVDPTWDDSDDILRYDYFNVSEATMRKLDSIQKIHNSEGIYTDNVKPDKPYADTEHNLTVDAKGSTLPAPTSAYLRDSDGKPAENINLNIGDERTYTVEGIESGGVSEGPSAGVVSFEYSDTDHAFVLKALSEGTAKVYVDYVGAKDSSGNTINGVKDTFYVTVKDPDATSMNMTISDEGSSTGTSIASGSAVDVKVSSVASENRKVVTADTIGTEGMVLGADVELISSDMSIASSESFRGNTGTLIVKKPGQAVITVRDKTHDVTSSFTLNVTPMTADGISLDKDALTMKKGSAYVLTASVTPENAYDKTVTWHSSDESIAAVTSGGAVIAKAKGTAQITASAGSAASGGCLVTVTVPVTGVTLDSNAIDLKKGETAEIKAVIAPSDASVTDVTWKSDNEDIVSAGSGVVTAKKGGTAVITAETVDGKFTASCKVTVTVPAESITLDKKDIEITEGKTAQLKASVLPEDATDKSIVWTSSDEKTASVDKDGVISAKAEGVAVITASAADGGCYALCCVSVKKRSSGTSSSGSSGSSGGNSSSGSSSSGSSSGGSASKPSDSTKPSDTSKPSDTAKPSDNTSTTAKPSDSSTPADTTKPDENTSKTVTDGMTGLEVTEGIYDDENGIYKDAEGKILSNTAVSTDYGIVITDEGGKPAEADSKVKLDGKTYLINDYGIVASSEKVKVNGKTYVAKKDGTIAKKAFVTLSATGNRIYVNGKGKIVKNKAFTVKGKKYLAKKSGALVKNGKVKQNGKIYTVKNYKVKKVLKVKKHKK